MSVKVYIGVEFHSEAQARAFLAGVDNGDDRNDPLLAAEYAIRGKLGDIGEGQDENGDSYADPVYLDVHVPDLKAAVDLFVDRPTTATDRGTLVIEPMYGAVFT